MKIILSIGVFQVLLVGFLMYDNKNFSLKDHPMVVLAMLIGCHFIIKASFLYIFQNEFLFEYSSTSFNFAYGPLLLDFVLKESKGKRLKRYHYIPALVVSVLYLIAGIASFIMREPYFINLYTSFVQYFILLSLAGYFGYSTIYLLIIDNKNASLKGIRNTLFLFVCCVIIGMVFNIHSLIIRGAFYLTFIALIVQYLRFEWRNKMANQVVGVSPGMAVGSVVEEKSEMKYQKSSLTDDQAKRHVGLIKQVMQNDKLFLRNELTLDDLCKKTQLPKHHISEALNNHLNKNFYQFVNEYRVEEAKRLIQKVPDIKLINLAFDCGFNNKATFNNYFKKITGYTPSEYRGILKVQSLS